MIDGLNRVGIKSIIPIEYWELLSDDYGKFPNAYSLSKSTISLPLYPSLMDDDIEHIINEVNKLI